jgi:hypothetical protein
MIYNQSMQIATIDNNNNNNWDQSLENYFQQFIKEKKTYLQKHQESILLLVSIQSKFIYITITTYSNHRIILLIVTAILSTLSTIISYYQNTITTSNIEKYNKHLKCYYGYQNIINLIDGQLSLTTSKRMNSQDFCQLITNMLSKIQEDQIELLIFNDDNDMSNTKNEQYLQQKTILPNQLNTLQTMQLTLKNRNDSLFNVNLDYI